MWKDDFPEAAGKEQKVSNGHHRVGQSQVLGREATFISFFLFLSFSQIVIAPSQARHR